MAAYERCRNWLKKGTAKNNTSTMGNDMKQSQIPSADRQTQDSVWVA